jgi:hypothetical protein
VAENLDSALDVQSLSHTPFVTREYVHGQVGTDGIRFPSGDLQIAPKVRTLTIAGLGM